MKNLFFTFLLTLSCCSLIAQQCNDDFQTCSKQENIIKTTQEKPDDHT